MLYLVFHYRRISMGKCCAPSLTRRARLYAKIKTGRLVHRAPSHYRPRTRCTCTFCIKQRLAREIKFHASDEGRWLRLTTTQRETWGGIFLEICWEEKVRWDGRREMIRSNSKTRKRKTEGGRERSFDYIHRLIYRFYSAIGFWITKIHLFIFLPLCRDDSKEN